ncbi:MAG: hypothetical protein S0880_07325 [Actinomycetota bacterium]|nr:hypothetical protein [Actinomycetota bacterium]
MSRVRAVVTLVLWSAAVATAIWSLDRLGTGSLAAPPLRDPGALSAWAEDVGPVFASIAVLRLVAWGLAWYLALVTALGVVARLSRIPALVEWADLITLPPVRRVVSGAVGLSFAATSLAISALPATALVARDHVDLPAVDLAAPSLPFGGFVDSDDRDADDEPPVLRIEDMDEAAEEDEVEADADETDETDEIEEADATADEAADPVIDLTDAAEPVNGAADLVDEALDGAATDAGAFVRDLAERAAPAETADELPAPSPEVATEQAADVAPTTWTIESGDHLWHVAEDTVARHLGRPATDAEIAPYWQRLIDTNRDTLADPTNPDLVFPGQVFHLPPPG